MSKPMPIDKELIRIHAYLPVKLAELSKQNEKAALELLQAWGAGTMTIRKLWQEIQNQLGDAATSA